MALGLGTSSLGCPGGLNEQIGKENKQALPRGLGCSQRDHLCAQREHLGCKRKTPHQGREVQEGLGCVFSTPTPFLGKKPLLPSSASGYSLPGHGPLSPPLSFICGVNAVAFLCWVPSVAAPQISMWFSVFSWLPEPKHDIRPCRPLPPTPTQCSQHCH